MKKILFCLYGLGVGGIEKCLVNLLNVLPETYEVDILLMNPQYDFQDQIKRNVHFIDLFDYVMNVEDTPAEIKKRRSFKLLLRYCAFRLRLRLRRNPWKGFLPLPDRYDIAISYSQNGFAPYYVIDKVNADKKVLWYHNGAYEQKNHQYQIDRKYYPSFDHVVAVSADCAAMLREKFRFREGQLVVLRNICDTNAIYTGASEKIPASFHSDGYHIVTVGRLSAEKGPLLALEACKILRDEKFSVIWHWVGGGNQENELRARIHELGLRDHFLLEGNQINPYAFMKAAHIYVQPSYYEAYSTTITEAKVLCKPIVTTDVGGMREQLVDGVNALIVSAEAEAIAGAIASLLENSDRREAFCDALKKEDFSSEKFLQEYERTVFW